ncbi:MAG: antibiotic biosynthesis monooxygenase [Breznakibacter sp.]|nr:antibiotic biosynthesis monooxygenase [Breznakibacter sp.]
MKKIINARIVVKPAEIDNFILAADEIVSKSNLETGCLVYKLFQEVGKPTSFIFYEEYENQAAIDFHNATPHFKKFIVGIKDMLQESPKIEIY